MKTLLINSDGIVGANPEMELPTFNAWRDSQEIEDQAMKRFWQGFVPFDDQEKAKELCWNYHPESDFFGKGLISMKASCYKFKPNTIIETDIEYEVVWQCRPLVMRGHWVDCVKVPTHRNPRLEYRTMLRLKD